MNSMTLKAAVAGALLMGAAGIASAEAMAKADYQSTKDGIEATRKSALEGCKSLSGNAKDICQVQAKADASIAKAELDARNNGTLEAAYDARVARAKARYDVAKEKCDDFAGNEKDVCVKEAKSAQTRALADAKADNKVVEARVDATIAKVDAEYKVAIEKCDTYAGDVKQRCVLDAKQRFGKS